MQLKPFLLDAWLDRYEHDIEFNLAASTGHLHARWRPLPDGATVPLIIGQ